MNKNIFFFREQATYWLIKILYLESVLFGEQGVRF